MRPVFAATSEYPVGPNDRIRVSVTEAQVQLWPSVNQKNLKVVIAGNDSDFSIERGENQFEIRSRDQLSKTDFGQTNKTKNEVTIYYPASLPIDVHVLEGGILANKISKEALLHVQKGKILVKDSNASLRLHCQKGEISIVDSQGRMSVDSYSAVVNVRNWNGDLDLQNFAGDSQIEKAKGFLSFVIGSGSAKIVTSSGNLQFELSKGSLNVNNFGGRVEGQSSDGTVNLNLAAEGDLSLRSQAGKVTVSTAPGSGALLNLATAEGDIYLPAPLKVNRESSQKSFRGRLKGEAAKSNIFIRSQAGAIFIK